MNDDVLLLAEIRPTAIRPCHFTCSLSGSTKRRPLISVRRPRGVNHNGRCFTLYEQRKTHRARIPVLLFGRTLNSRNIGSFIFDLYSLLSFPVHITCPCCVFGCTADAMYISMYVSELALDCSTPLHPPWIATCVWPVAVNTRLSAAGTNRTKHKLLLVRSRHQTRTPTRSQLHKTNRSGMAQVQVDLFCHPRDVLNHPLQIS